MNPGYIWLIRSIAYFTGFAVGYTTVSSGVVVRVCRRVREAGSITGG